MLSISAIAQTAINNSTADTTSAATVINRSTMAYSQLKLYLDSGKLIQAIEVMGQPVKTAKIFKTAYADDDSFNFEYYELGKSNSLYTINRSFNIVRSWWALTNKTSTPNTINLALGAAAGVSSGLSMMIPQLLLVKEFKRNNVYNSIRNPVMLGYELINNVDCYKISATERFTEGGKFTIWVAKKDMLIRKVEIERVLNMEKTAAATRRMDSIMNAQHPDKKPDAATARRDSALKTAMAMMKQLESQNYKKDRTVKETTFYFPYTLKNPSPELFKFRPNREVEM
jgi:hypothetical protein